MVWYGTGREDEENPGLTGGIAVALPYSHSIAVLYWLGRVVYMALLVSN